MSTPLEALQAEVSRLSPADRSRLLEHLIASLEVDDEVEAAWETVADEREADVAAGKVRPIPFEEAIARLEARFQGTVGVRSCGLPHRSFDRFRHGDQDCSLQTPGADKCFDAHRPVQFGPTCIDYRFGL